MKEQLKERTKAFHKDVIRLCEAMPRTVAGYELTKQMIRSAGSIGANYRAACRAKSSADFIYKLEIVIEEADETMYWLEVSEELGLLHRPAAQKLIAEANELVSIFISSVKTVKANQVVQKNTKAQPPVSITIPES